MKGILSVAAIAASVSLAFSAGAQDIVKIESNASLNIGGVHAAVIHFTPEWNYTSFDFGATCDAGYPKASEAKGVFKVKNGEFAFSESVKGSVYTASLKSASGVESNGIALEFKLPAANFAGTSINVDGTDVALPQEVATDNCVLNGGESFTSITIPVGNGKLVAKDCSGRFCIQDDRKYDNTNFVLRIFFTQNEGSVKDSSLSVKFEKSN